MYGVIDNNSRKVITLKRSGVFVFKNGCICIILNLSITQIWKINFGIENTSWKIFVLCLEISYRHIDYISGITGNTGNTCTNVYILSPGNHLSAIKSQYI